MSLEYVHEIRTTPITRVWNPNLNFQLRLTAEQKRMYATFHRFKNYRDRIGRPIQFWADPLATDEIRQLRGYINRSILVIPHD